MATEPWGVLMQGTDYKYTFTTITATYNNEDTIEEALESIVCQSFGIDRIQMILISDGSTDGTDEICQRYAEKYPENVVYIRKENGGVSSARNMGLEYVEGKYVIFFDGDDSWDEEAFANIAKFFDKHYDEIDFCSCKMEYSGERAGQIHPLNFKFTDDDRVVDLKESPDFVNTTIGNAVFKAASIQGQRFIQDLWYGEDSTFNAEVLLNKLKCGIIASATFFYRMDIVRNTASGGARSRKEFFLDIPRDYYLRIIQMSQERYGEVIDFIQQTVLYDIRWRLGSWPGLEKLSDEEKQQYLELMHEVMTHVSDKNIRNVRGHNEFRKAYLMSLKYGRNILEGIDSKRGAKEYLYSGDVFAFSPACRGLINIRALQEDGDSILIDGFSRNIIFGNEYELIAKDASGRTFDITYGEYPDTATQFYDLLGESLCVRRSFRIRIPAEEGLVLSISISIAGFECLTVPLFAEWTGITGRLASYMALQNWLITRRKHGLALHAYSKRDHFLLESRKDLQFVRELKYKPILHGQTTYRIHQVARTAKPKQQVAFVSIRKDGVLEDNLALVKQELGDVRTVTYSKMWPHKNSDRRKFANAIYRSKVIVTDDYLYFLRNFDISPDHHVIQLWHACGAFKKFGMEDTNVFPAVDNLYHKRYGLVSVSSESIRPIYANAFNIPVDRVQALGVPRTDVFFDPSYREKAASTVYAALPQLVGKRVILYAPTFRDAPYPRRHFVPDIDFKELSRQLPDDTVLVLRPHPVMTDPILPETSFDNIFEVRDVSTQDIMFVSDLLVTDYSSVIFEYSLLNKPMLFYCYDFDDYDRDFYLDYNSDLPGKLIMDQDSLAEALADEATYETTLKLDAFREKYMSACDGHSCERIANYIRSFL
jgi:CDP-glycerol glycerophosphotransferase (TagB/SpsB family)/glycosyltransferase involved in cell wall biosynthesis